ncbi:DUF2793 domain-containing protein [Pseudomonas aeruginosa]|uniref:DUF2793 domain-containing protein n=1 Tax=Pseudomonas aeruginosa TaxID=287 RepID=UPI001F31F45E|nr:DUF2793 domain-containing protein [Pseudomonas aeruginosa]HCL4163530.1 DUF2793 domain-containing protein [Pseudomonas aeruginosa]
MSLTMGPNTGLLINGAPGEGHYSELIRMLRWDDFLRQPVVKGRVATLPTTGQAEGDTYIFTGSGASQNRLARWWVVGATAGTWEYLTPKLGWRVQVANEATPAGQVKTYEFGASGWTELVGGMADAPSDGKLYARESGAWAELGTAAGADLNTMPFLNLMPDSGRFAGVANPLSLYTGTTFTASGFFTGYNGATVADGGKFVFDNSTNGGSGAAINQRVQDLMGAMGRTGGDARYGIEFITALVTMGSGTQAGGAGADGTTRYLTTVNGSRALFISNKQSTAVFWIRAETGSVHILPGAPVYRNGVLVAPGAAITPAMGWVHIRVIASSSRGYLNDFPGIYSAPGTVCALAVPAFFGGVVDVGIHAAPIATVNSQSA